MSDREGDGGCGCLLLLILVGVLVVTCHRASRTAERVDAIEHRIGLEEPHDK